MKANLRRKLVIARELAAAGSSLDLEALNAHRRPSHKPRHFTVELTKQQELHAKATSGRIPAGLLLGYDS